MLLFQGGIDMGYSLEFVNGEGWTVKHFGADEIGFVQMEIFFLAAQCFLVNYLLFVITPSGVVNHAQPRGIP